MTELDKGWASVMGSLGRQEITRRAPHRSRIKESHRRNGGRRQGSREQEVWSPGKWREVRSV